ncbi:Vms1/Ankzf1 family peptidyl-tRNA hydrolase [Phytoactinopolyspora endophytica]|uniref:baeRF2 domain-containing protein n=1 Tax=Phytoactinopolyspora endophytica TaxID=1642495 RepID=UPI00101E15F5|nr:Vms1/Ankzf1 family peptidyl-tRNA hydrolase [Phytoactinopolyspora endophytica]
MVANNLARNGKNTRLVSEICQHPGPFLSVYLDVRRDVEEAVHQLNVRWRSSREELLRQGAPPDLVETVGDRILAEQHASGAAARMVVAADGRILMDDVVTVPGDHQALTWGPLPDLTGWLADRNAMLPLLVVLADREGAEFERYEAWPETPKATASVQGETEHLTKVAVGGWSHKRYQRRAENVWHRNAEQVVTEIEEQVGAGVRIVALAGDVRAQREIHQSVSERTRALLVDLESGSRAAGASREALDHAVDQAIRNVVITDHLEAIRELEQEAGRQGAAAIGLDDVLPKLVQGQVRTVFITPDTAAARTVRPGGHPGIPLPKGALEQDAVRADLAVLCAAVATDAEVLVGPWKFSDDGVAAILRW